MIVIENPTLQEIEEMLALVKKAHDLAPLELPEADEPIAQCLHRGWTYLFYSDSYEPLAVANFTFFHGRRHPWYNWAATQYCTGAKLKTICEAMAGLAQRHFKRGVKARIIDPHIWPLAKRMGFVPMGRDVFYLPHKKAEEKG